MTINAYDFDETYRRLLGRFTWMSVPACVHCGSAATASVQVGIVGLTIRLAAACPKFKLLANGPKPGEWYCGSCGRFFDAVLQSDAEECDVRFRRNVGL